MTRSYFAALAAALAIAGAGCSDAKQVPLAPAGRPMLALVDDAANAITLTRDVPLDSDVTMTFLATSGGATVELPGTGLRITVPPKAIKGPPMELTVTALAGDVVAYEFGPHGTRFARPLVLSQDLAGTSLASATDRSGVEGGYFVDRGAVNVRGRRARVNEFLPVALDSTESRIELGVSHFSGYLLATGRTDSTTTTTTTKK